MEWTGTKPAAEDDPEIWRLICQEKKRQRQVLEMKASENYCSRAVCESMSSCLNNKYSEGYPGNRYYGGNHFIDKIETLCQTRALEAFNLDASEWAVNVQTYSGSPANFAVCTGILKPHDRIMGLDVKDGGHLTHGHLKEDSTPISVASKYFETLSYRLDPGTGLIDYDKVLELAKLYKPKLLIAGPSSYTRLVDYKRFRAIADQVGALLLADIAHISGFIIAGLMPGPFDHADIVTTTTHKTMRAVRGGMILYRKGERMNVVSGKTSTYNLEDAINFGVFPATQGGPHNHAIAGVAVALNQAIRPEFRKYQEQTLKNAKAMEKRLLELDYTLVTGGTENHMVLIDLRPLNIDGRRIELACSAINITGNDYSCPGDYRDYTTGFRLGSPAMSSRGLLEDDFVQIVNFFDQAVKFALQVQGNTSSLEEYQKQLDDSSEVQEVRKAVVKFAEGFFMPGFDDF